MSEFNFKSNNNLMFSKNEMNYNVIEIENNNNNKRSLNTSEYYERKRFCNNESDFELNTDKNTDDDYEEMSEFDRKLMNISNQLINFNINLVDIDWPIFLNQSIDDQNNSINTHNSKPKEPQFPPKVGQIFFNYSLDALIKSEKRIAVFVGHKCGKTDELIIKIGIESGCLLLENENDSYNALKGGKSVPKLIDFVRWKVYNDNYTVHNYVIVVIEKLGLNLAQLMSNSVSLSIEMILNFAVQMIHLIEDFHQKGRIHCGLNPENFVIENELSLKLFLIGLSSSKPYLVKKFDGTVEHMRDQKSPKRRDHKLLKGDPNYHSIGYHNGFCASRRDDMESIGYCIIYLIKGSLPWISVQRKDLSPAKNAKLIGVRMQSTTIDKLCEGLSPNFAQYFDLISGLGFEDKPNYEALRQCFSCLNES